MPTEMIKDDPFGYLRYLLYAAGTVVRQMIADRDMVYDKYGQLFDPDNLDRLTAEDFKGFLLYENNRHWWGIHRHQKSLTADMPRLREALTVLLDESRPLVGRLNWIMPRSGPKPVPGLGPAVITPILQVVYPYTYGVWNSIAEGAMTRLGLWPTFQPGSGFGEQYVAVNGVNLEAARRLDVDLWTIDSLWWKVEKEHEPTRHQFEGGGGATSLESTTRRLHAVETFVCESCFRSKPATLRSPRRPDLCTDCLGD